MADEADEEPLDSARDWVAEHTRRYVETDGAEGHLWRGYPTLVLTTRGRRSGRLRRNALIYGKDGNNYVVVASKGGAPTHPLWYRNLEADPNVRVQVLADKFPARARTASPEEKGRLWPMMVQVYPPYAEYQEKAKPHRDIPVVILEPQRS
jgi:deazaflavin-dependent oxidoreductase (nitroreductase family)